MYSNIFLKYSIISIFLLVLTLFNSCKDNTNTIIPPVGGADTLSFFTATYSSGVSIPLIGGAETSEGGYIICGYNDAGAFGSKDIYAAKISKNGNVEWANLYGGSGIDSPAEIIKTSDGNFMITGTTNSFSGTNDPFLLKISGAGGVLWSKYYRWQNEDYSEGVVQSTDGGFVITGYSNTFSIGALDIYTLKTDADGNFLWANCYGGANDDYGYAICNTGDGNFMVAGNTFSFGSQGDAYIMKLNSNGALTWSKNYGGASNDVLKDIVKVPNGYLVCGTSQSFGLSAETAYSFNIDNQDGFVYWSKVFPGNNGMPSAFYKCMPTTDGGYVFAGNIQVDPQTMQEMALVKLYGDGVLNYTHLFGGTLNDMFTSVIQRSNGKFLLAGNTNSLGSGNNDVIMMNLDISGKGCINENPIIPLSVISVTDVNIAASQTLPVTFIDVQNAVFNSGGTGLTANILCIDSTQSKLQAGK
ncbi:MAG: hypothetical protein IT280_10190 [Ignavibacteria bacterium]|nr:hypothetical protein [Ignavibacteria bacterium]